MKLSTISISWLLPILLTAAVAAGNGVSANTLQTDPVFKKLYGGSKFDEAHLVEVTADGNYLVIGRSSAGSFDNTMLKVLKVDPKGTLIWEQTYGGEGTEQPNSVLGLANGNYLIVGSSDSYDREADMKDMYALMIDSKGTKLWHKTYGEATSIDEAQGVTAGHDGGFLLVGTSLKLTDGGEAEPGRLYVIKISDNGELEWEKKMGGEGNEQGIGAVTTENGYTLLGNTESKGNGKWDAWMIGLDKEGSIKWDSTFGGGDNEMVNSLTLLDDGGYIISGYSYTFAEGSLDAWVVKADATGKQEWFKAYGDLSTDEAFKTIVTQDGHLVMVGYTDVWQGNEEGENISTEGINVLLVKMKMSGEKVWQKSIGGPGEQRGYDLKETKDGHLIITGFARPEPQNAGDMLLIKINQSGS